MEGSKKHTHIHPNQVSVRGWRNQLEIISGSGGGGGDETLAWHERHGTGCTLPYWSHTGGRIKVPGRETSRETTNW